MRSECYKYENDEYLVPLAQHGDRDAFDELATRYCGALLVIAREFVRSSSSAEDVVQEAMLIALHSLKKLREPAKFGSWLYAITRFRAQRVFTEERRVATTDIAELSAAMVVTPSAEETHLDAERMEEIKRLLEAMKSEYRTVFNLRYLEQWSIDQIATFLALPTTTVNWRLHHARQSLRKSLTEGEDHGYDRRNNHKA